MQVQPQPTQERAGHAAPVADVNDEVIARIGYLTRILHDSLRGLGLDKALEEAHRHDTVGFLILPDPRTYRHVIGQGGSEINRIRKQSGTKIQVPRDQSGGEAIEIVGSSEGVEKARDLILEVVARNA